MEKKVDPEAMWSQEASLWLNHGHWDRREVALVGPVKGLFQITTKKLQTDQGTGQKIKSMS